MGMDLTPLDNLNLRQTLDQQRGWTEPLILLLPSFTDTSDYDVDGQAQQDVSGGLGRTASWLVLEIQATVREVTVTLVNFGRVPASAELGDLIVSVALENEAAMRRVYTSEYGYVYFRGERWRPRTIESVGVGQAAESQVLLKRFGAQSFVHASY